MSTIKTNEKMKIGKFYSVDGILVECVGLNENNELFEARVICVPNDL